MTLEELKPLIQKGEIGLIPRWLGYIKYNYGLGQIYFVNGDYRLYEKELVDKLNGRNDLYYII